MNRILLCTRRPPRMLPRIAPRMAAIMVPRIGPRKPPRMAARAPRIAPRIVTRIIIFILKLLYVNVYCINIKLYFFNFSLIVAKISKDKQSKYKESENKINFQSKW